MGVFVTISSGAGFLPSTVLIGFIGIFTMACYNPYITGGIILYAVRLIVIIVSGSSSRSVIHTLEN